MTISAVPALCMQRERYDATGRIEKSVEEEFSDSFAGGKASVCPLRNNEVNCCVEVHLCIIEADLWNAIS